MPPMNLIRASNERIASELPERLVAVFVGGTNGIGETTAKQFALHAVRPKIYIVGRSQEAGNRIVAECTALNKEGEYVFIGSLDLALLKNVDTVCEEIIKKEQAVNLLFLSQGTLESGPETAEGLDHRSALMTYGRNRFAVNLLPLLQKAKGLRRVVSVLVGGREGPVDMDNLQGRNLTLLKILTSRAHRATITTLSLQQLAKKAPTVSFIHGFPGIVKSGIGRGSGIAMAVVRAALVIGGPFLYIPIDESGERHLYLATSAKYPAGASGESVNGISLGDKDRPAHGIDGQAGSGVYTVDEWGEPAGGESVKRLLEKLRNDGSADKIWADSEEQFLRITGTNALK